MFVPSTDTFKTWTGALADWVEIIAAIIIALAVVEATLRTVWLFLQRHLPPEAKENMRLRLGRWLAVSLEFELAADILRTAIAPSWDEIGKLAAIAAIRTLLNYFLEKEIQRAAASTADAAAQAARPTSGSFVQRNRTAQQVLSQWFAHPGAPPPAASSVSPRQAPNPSVSPPHGAPASAVDDSSREPSPV